MYMKEQLERYSCKMRALICRYEGNFLRESRPFTEWGEKDDTERSTFSVNGAKWECDLKVSPVLDREDGADLEVTFRLIAGKCSSAGVAVAFDFSQWSTDNYVLMPGAVYNGNRFRCLPMPYPPLFRDPVDHRVDLPITVTDVPRLCVSDGSSRIQQTTGDFSTPAMGFHAPHIKKGFWLLTRQQTRFGNSGMFIEESDDRSRATFMVTAPCVREMRQTGCGRVPSEDRGADWKEGDEVTLHLRLYFFTSPEIQTLFDRFVEIRKDLTGPTVLRHMLPFSRAWEIQEEKFNKQNWKEEGGYYHSGSLRGTSNSIVEDWEFGWCGGGMVTHPLLFAGNEQSRQRSLRAIDTIITRSQAPSGFFYGAGRNGKEWYSDAFDVPHPFNMLLIRKNVDGLYYFLKQFLVIKARDPQWRLPEAWKKAVLRLSDAFVRLWDKYGQFGQFVDVETGDIIVGGSTCAAMAPAALALAGEYFECPRYLEVAEASARHYYARDVRSGLTYGAPGEILQCPDMESSYAMLESFVVLYEITQKREWLSAAEEMAKQFATWIVSYDYVFPPESLFGRLDMRTTGSIYANVQNKHSSPGICTMSGDALLKLYRATGNRFYLEILRDTAHNITQYLSREDRPIGKMKPGWMNERVNMSDWEGLDKVGETFNGSGFAEVSCMLTTVEIPGLYVQPDTGMVWAIDHINIDVLARQGDKLNVRLSNPTGFPARVRTLIESSHEAGKPLGFNALWNRPVISLEAGEQKNLSFVLPDCKIERLKS